MELKQKNRKNVQTMVFEMRGDFKMSVLEILKLDTVFIRTADIWAEKTLL